MKLKSTPYLTEPLPLFTSEGFDRSPINQINLITGRYLVKERKLAAAADIEQLMQPRGLYFLVAFSNPSPRVIEPNDCFDFFKSEVAAHLFVKGKLRLEDYPNEYFYYASQFSSLNNYPVVLLEMQH